MGARSVRKWVEGKDWTRERETEIDREGEQEGERGGRRERERERDREGSDCELE
jgi:hypothetical protein